MNDSTVSGSPPPSATSLREGELDLLAGDLFVCRISTAHGRFAVRAYAYSLSTVDPRRAKALLDAVDREG